MGRSERRGSKIVVAELFDEASEAENSIAEIVQLIPFARGFDTAAKMACTVFCGSGASKVSSSAPSNSASTSSYSTRAASRHASRSILSSSASVWPRRRAPPAAW